jgi:Kef-type K+ transport system membrane component KefB
MVTESGKLFDPLETPLSIFLVQVVIILVFSRAIGKLLFYIKQPMVIGEIIAGIILG